MFYPTILLLLWWWLSFLHEHIHLYHSTILDDHKQVAVAPILHGFKLLKNLSSSILAYHRIANPIGLGVLVKFAYDFEPLIFSTSSEFS